MNSPDTIEIRRLRVVSQIGVADAEQAHAQTLLVTVRMMPCQGFAGLADDIARTLDYAVVAQTITDLAAARPRRLIETLAIDIADWLLARFPLARVAVTVEKHILPDTEFVAVHLERGR
jgi:dihydroneopterin aldolase